MLVRASDPQSAAEGELAMLDDGPVPEEQRPVVELAAMKASPVFGWATLDLGGYVQRLSLVWLATLVLVALPVSSYTYDPARQPLEFALAGGVGALLAVVVIALRAYLGWTYVGDRLLSATVEYEETGWYDGQVWLKPPAVLARDRLLGAYQVKPVLARLRRTLLASAAALLGSALVLAGVVQVNGPAGVLPAPREVTREGLIFSDRVRSLDDLLYDDAAAEAEAAAQGGRPGYCADRYFRAAAGGQYCRDRR